MHKLAMIAVSMISSNNILYRFQVTIYYIDTGVILGLSEREVL